MTAQKLTKDTFKTTVEQAQGTILLDFFATWCGPCRMVAPILEEIAAGDYGCAVHKIDVDEEMELAQIFGIDSIPTLVVLRDGKEVTRAVGMRSKEQILAML